MVTKEEKVKAMKSERKENVQGPNRWEGNWDSNQQFRPEGGNKQSTRTELKKQEFQKMRSDLGTSGTTLNVPTSES